MPAFLIRNPPRRRGRYPTGRCTPGNAHRRTLPRRPPGTPTKIGIDFGTGHSAAAARIGTIGVRPDGVRGDLEVAPDSLFLTGGMSGAPCVHAAAQTRFPHARVVRGDPSLGVVSGLAAHAGD